MTSRPHGRPPRLGGGGAAGLVLRNGRIHVGQVSAQPRFVEALALRDGRITALGGNAQVLAQADGRTTIVDLEGRLAIPGLIDSHIHLVRAGLTWTEEVRWFEVPSLEEALERLEHRARRVPAGTWLRAIGGWHPGQFAEGRGPTSEELSRRFPDHPVYVQFLYQEAVVNRAGLDAAGITADTADPPRGSFDRAAGTGEPTGTLRGVGAFQHCLDRMPPPDFEAQVAGTRELMAVLNGWGVTGATDACGLGTGPESYEPLFELWRRDGVTVRTRLFVGPLTRGDERAEVTGWLRHLRPGFGDAWLRHVGLGEILVFGCHDLEGLTDFAIDEPDGAELEVLLREAAGRRWPVHLHAVRDGTVGAVLDVWERIAQDHSLNALRWSLAHADEVSDQNLDRIARLGVGVAVQDRLVYRATDSATAWGAEAVRRAPPLRSIRERGIPLGAGTDATRVTSPNPWVALWWMVTGRTLDAGPERDRAQCLDRTEALEAFTAGSAWFSAEEAERGRLEVGFAADLAVLDDDYFAVAEDDIRHLRSLLTLVDGRPVHATGPYAGLG